MVRFPPYIPTFVTLDAGLFDRIVDQARAAYPNECCGLISGSAELGSRLIPMNNAAPLAATRFAMDPGELVQAMRELRESGETLTAIYHSHPAGPADPSVQDVEQANYPHAFHIIVSLATFEQPVVRAFRIVDGRVLAADLRVIV